jgi:FixJ family two-component response regulator
MKEINPEVRAMLSSGFSIGDMPGELLEEGVLDFLAKPYRIEQLSEKVKRAISRRR